MDQSIAVSVVGESLDSSIRAENVQAKMLFRAAVMDQANAVSFGEESLDRSIQAENVKEKSKTLFRVAGSKLYGRDKEEKQLLKAYERRMGTTQVDVRELILISGVSGTGKTALATNVLKEHVTSQGGFFLKGKFDTLETPENYTPIIAALSDFVHQVLQRGEATVEEFKRKVESCCLTERLIFWIVPELNKLIGSPSLLENLDNKSAGAQSRINVAFLSLFRKLCSPKTPFVLFLDDLQWAEPASLELLSTLVGDKELSGLAVIGACRGNEVSIDHHLSVMLREMENDGIPITNIELKNFDSIALSDFLGDVLDQTPDESHVLAQFIIRETEGNIFFARQLLRYLVSEEFLLQINGKWTLKLDVEVMGKLNVSLLLSESMLKMDKNVCEVLMIAACLGAEFDSLVLQNAANIGNIDQLLRVAADNSFIECDPRSKTWHFVHDQIQMSAYDLIPDHERQAVHLQIGRKLWAGLSNDELDNHLSVVVNQLRLGATLLTEQEEKDRLALFLLRAGEKATASSAFLTAASHLNLGIKLLGDSHWRDQYNLSLDLFNAAAEVEYCNANFARMDELIEAVLEHARNPGDKIRPLTLSVYSLGSRNETSKAIDLGFEVLADLGEPIPKRVGTFKVLLDLMMVKRTLARKSDSQILASPQLFDRKKHAALRLMALLYSYTLNCRPVYAPIIAIKIVQVSLVHGLSGVAAVGFSSLAMLLCNAFSDITLGIRLARIGLEIMDRFQAREWAARVHIAVYGFCLTWTEKWQSQLKPLLVGHRVGLAGGDIEFSMLCAAGHSSLAFHSCAPLHQVWLDSQAFLDMMNAHKQTNMIQFIRPTLQLVLNFLGRSKDPKALDGEALCFDESMNQAFKTQNVTILAFLHFAKLILKGFWLEFEEAEIAAMALENNPALAGFTPFTFGPLYLHMGIASAVMASDSGHRKQRMNVAQRCLRKLKSFSKTSRLNFINKVCFLEAEILVARGKYEEAVLKYELSIESASAACFWHEMGLAYERYASLLQKINRGPDSTYCLEKAIAAYQEWGASAKVSALRCIIPVQTLKNKDLAVLPPWSARVHTMVACPQVLKIEQGQFLRSDISA